MRWTWARKMALAKPPHDSELLALGWSSFFDAQVDEDETDLVPVRVAHIHRARISGYSSSGLVDLKLPASRATGDYAVGDFVLANANDFLVRRRLERTSLLSRRRGDGSIQLSAANVDTLFIVTSCNDDFSIPRLERFLAMASQSEIAPVLVLTKSDTAEDAAPFMELAAGLARDLEVVVVDPRQADALAKLQPWFGVGKTAALTGSSGVGKSTLVNTLAALHSGTAQVTDTIRVHDSKGRHTTTSRSLHPVAGGGWVVDTPGIRSVHLGEAAESLDVVFAEISEVASQCKFSNCTHTHEPSCAVLAALSHGSIDPQRYSRWRKLQEEDAVASAPRRGHH